MKGLIMKDLLCLRKGLVSTILVLGIYFALAFTGVWEVSFIAGVLSVLVAMLPMSCFSYDHAAKWDLYARTLPVGPAAVVGARYCAVLLLTGLALVASLTAGALGSVLGRMDDWAAYLAATATSLLLGILFNSALLPLLYKFGAERARIVFYGVLAAVVGLAFLVLIPLGGLEALTRLDAPSPALAAALPPAAALAGAALLALSFPLSVRFYRSAEL